ncbi:MAG TPA: YtxH domain-containing protein [Anaerolineales bacterium]|jgi:gas vesicle protein|nr:YtxH domain-containing protein [Anaerolineales bacterium]
MSDRNGDFGSYFAGFLMGGLIGAAVALLMAPASGEETRKYIREKGIELRDRTVESLEAAAEEARQRADELTKLARERANELTKEARELSGELRGRADELRTRGGAIAEDVRLRGEAAVEAAKKPRGGRTSDPGDGGKKS